jgi:hypothetical protein
VESGKGLVLYTNMLYYYVVTRRLISACLDILEWWLEGSAANESFLTSS